MGAVRTILDSCGDAGKRRHQHILGLGNGKRRCCSLPPGLVLLRE
jgi:hypothetical protein